MVDILAGLARGKCLALGESVPVPTRLKFYPASPPPNSDDIDFHDKWINGPEDLCNASIGIGESPYSS